MSKRARDHADEGEDEDHDAEADDAAGDKEAFILRDVRLNELPKHLPALADRWNLLRAHKATSRAPHQEALLRQVLRDEMLGPFWACWRQAKWDPLDEHAHGDPSDMTGITFFLETVTPALATIRGNQREGETDAQYAARAIAPANVAALVQSLALPELRFYCETIVDATAAGMADVALKWLDMWFHDPSTLLAVVQATALGLAFQLDKDHELYYLMMHPNRDSVTAGPRLCLSNNEANWLGGSGRPPVTPRETRAVARCQEALRDALVGQWPQRQRALETAFFELCRTLLLHIGLGLQIRCWFDVASHYGIAEDTIARVDPFTCLDVVLGPFAHKGVRAGLVTGFYVSPVRVPVLAPLLPYQ
jgi:hypothetical protein